MNISTRISKLESKARPAWEAAWERFWPLIWEPMTDTDLELFVRGWELINNTTDYSGANAIIDGWAHRTGIKTDGGPWIEEAEALIDRAHAGDISVTPASFPLADYDREAWPEILKTLRRGDDDSLIAGAFNAWFYLLAMAVEKQDERN